LLDDAFGACETPIGIGLEAIAISSEFLAAFSGVSIPDDRLFVVFLGIAPCLADHTFFPVFLG
jgi:hypothetical protein